MNKNKSLNKKIILRVKKKILKEAVISDKKYITTYRDIKRYFKYFNKILFKDELNSFNDIKIKRYLKLRVNVLKIFLITRVQVFLFLRCYLNIKIR